MAYVYSNEELMDMIVASGEPRSQISITGSRLSTQRFTNRHFLPHENLTKVAPRGHFIDNLRPNRMQEGGLVVHKAFLYWTICFRYFRRKPTNQVQGVRWIGRCGPVSRSPRSPHLNPIDFFLWDIKFEVYQTKIDNTDELRESLTAATNNLHFWETRKKKETFYLVRQNCVRRAQSCLEVKQSNNFCRTISYFLHAFVVYRYSFFI